MPVQSLLVVAHLLLADPPQDPEAECKARRKARAAPAVVAETCRRAFEAVPGAPGDRRTALLAAAHAAYQQALSDDPDPALACAHVGMLRTYAAQLAALPPGERPGDRASVAEALEQVDPRLVAGCIPPEANQETPPQNAASLTPTANSPLPPVQTTPRPGADKPPRRVLRFVGGTVLGVGLGAGLATVGALVRGAELRTRAESVHDTYNGGTQIPMDISREYDADIARGERANHLAVAFGVSAAVLTATGVALLVVDRRGRSRRVALSPLMLPASGVRFAVEF